jgi:hypothetical protein
MISNSFHVTLGQSPSLRSCCQARASDALLAALLISEFWHRRVLDALRVFVALQICLTWFEVLHIRVAGIKITEADASRARPDLAANKRNGCKHQNLLAQSGHSYPSFCAAEFTSLERSHTTQAYFSTRSDVDGRLWGHASLAAISFLRFSYSTIGENSSPGAK